MDIALHARRTLAFSNAMALPPLLYALGNGRTADAIFVAVAACASIAMHLSDTKRGMDPGGWLAVHSSLLLNIDRAAAFTAASYFGALWWNAGCSLGPAVCFVAGLLFSLLGEQSPFLSLYVAYHAAWHCVAFMCMYMVMLLADK